MAERYFKRYRMKFDLRTHAIPSPKLPPGFSWTGWSEELVDAHARVKAACFAEEMDSILFPCLGTVAGCRKLMRDIAGQNNFLASATWLIRHPNDFAQPRFCGTIQGMSRGFRIGAIQNVGITPDCRGLGLGKALVARSLIGFQAAGIQKVFLDVTSANLTAVKMYEKIGFRIDSTSFLAAQADPVEIEHLAARYSPNPVTYR